MQDAETGDTAQPDRDSRDPDRDGNSTDAQGGALDDFATLFTLISASIKDTARLLGLETRLVVKTIVMLLVLGVVLALVLVGIWLSVTLIVAAGLYEYTRLGMTASIALASLINVTGAGALLFVMTRLFRRLAFPETRLAVRNLLGDASRAMHQQE